MKGAAVSQNNIFLIIHSIIFYDREDTDCLNELSIIFYRLNKVGKKLILGAAHRAVLFLEQACRLFMLFLILFFHCSLTALLVMLSSCCAVM